MVFLKDEGQSVVERGSDHGPPGTSVARIAPGVRADARRFLAVVKPLLETGRRRVFRHPAQGVERIMEGLLPLFRERAGRLRNDHHKTEVFADQVPRGGAIHVGRGETAVNVGPVPVVAHAAEQRRLSQGLRQRVEALRLEARYVQESPDLSLHLTVLHAPLLEGCDRLKRRGGGGIRHLGGGRDDADGEEARVLERVVGHLGAGAGLLAHLGPDVRRPARVPKRPRQDFERRAIRVSVSGAHERERGPGFFDLERFLLVLVPCESSQGRGLRGQRGARRDLAEGPLGERPGARRIEIAGEDQRHVVRHVQVLVERRERIVLQRADRLQIPQRRVTIRMLGEGGPHALQEGDRGRLVIVLVHLLR